MASGHHGLVRLVAVAACLVLVAATVTGSIVVRPGVLVLQFNLCDSGIAACYTGRAVRQAAAIIAARSPDVVTLSEVCRDSVTALGTAMREASPGGTVVPAFYPAPDRRTGQATRCRDGQPFGVGLILRFADPIQTVTHASKYPMQDRDDPEERVWLCVAAAARFVACSTHLAINPSIAVAQCGYLLGTAIPALRPRSAMAGGDFNLRRDGEPSMRGCVPPGYVSRGDGGLQHVVATNDFTVRASERIDMAGTTDHPALLVRATLGSGVGSR